MKITMLCTMNDKNYSLTMHTDSADVCCKCTTTDRLITSDVTLAKVLAKCVEAAHVEALAIDAELSAAPAARKPAGLLKSALIAALVMSGTATAAYASNADVNNFLTKAHSDNMQEAVNAFDNLNARDRMVVAGISDLTDIHGKISDIIGTADQLHHTGSVPAGWNPAKTQEMIDAAHQPVTPYAAPPAAPVVYHLPQDLQKLYADYSAKPTQEELRQKFAELKAAQAEGQALEQSNRERVAAQHTDPAAVAQAAADAAQAAADQAQHDANWNGVKVADAHHAIMVAQADIDKNAAQIQGQELEQANRDRTFSQHVDVVTQQDVQNIDDQNSKQDAAIHHAQVNADAAIKGNAVQSQFIKANADAVKTAQSAADQAQHDANWNSVKIDDAHHAIMVAQTDIDANAAAIQGQKLEQANRDRTSSQHVKAVTQQDVQNLVDQNSKQDAAIHHAQVNADAAIKGNAVQSQFIKANADAVQGLELSQANRDRTAEQHVETVSQSDLQNLANKNAQQDAAIHHAQVNADAAIKGNAVQSQFIKANADAVQAAQATADQAQHDANWNSVKIEDAHHAIMVAQTDIDANASAIEGQALEQANRDRTSGQHVEIASQQDVKNLADKNGQQDAAIHHAQVNADAAIKGNAVQSQFIKANADAIQGMQMEQANRDRTAEQHVDPVVGHDGKDGINGVDGKDGAAGKDGTDGKDGVTTVVTDTATQETVQDLKGAALADANRARTAGQHVTEQPATTDTNIQEAVKGLQLVQANQQRVMSQRVTAQPETTTTAPVEGKAGKDGADGKDGAAGVTTTVNKVVADTATRDQVSSNSKLISRNAGNIRAVGEAVQAQGEFVQRQSAVISHNSARIDQNTAQIQHNSQQIDRNKREIDDTKKDLKRGLNNAAAMTGLHYHSNDSYAISTGTANGDGAAIAGGLSHGFTQHTAATVQASTSMDGGWMASVGFSGDF